MAARAANSEKLTEEIGRVFKLLQEQIAEAYELCLQKRRVTECCVQQCRALLKSWPVRSTAENKERETCRQEASSLTTNDTHKEDTKVESNAEDAEKQDLAALDQLLAKAQRAREIQNKIDETGVMVSHKKKVVKKPIATANKAPIQQSAKQMPAKTVKPTSKQSVPTKKPPAKKAPMRSTYSASYGKPLSARSFTRQPPSSRGRNSANLFLDSVMKKDTVEQLRHSDAIAGPLSQLPTSTVESKDTQPKEVKPEKEQLSHSSTAAYCPETNQHQENRQQNSSVSNSELKVNIHGNGLCEVAKPHPSKGACQSALAHANPVKPAYDSLALSKSGTGVSIQKEEQFDPFAEGASLSLPSKYRKLKSTSARLYAELRKMLEKEDRRSFCQHFVDRLEARFDLETLNTHKEIHEQACHVIQEHEKLTRLTGDVVKRSCNLTDTSLWQETYKCYRLWQVILSKFNELQRRTQLLLEAEEQLSSSCPCGNCNAFDRDISRDTASARERAYPREGCILLSKWLPEGIENGVAAESFARTPQQELTDLTYNSDKELQKLVRLHHEVQLLRFQLYVEEQAGDKLLPLLERLDPSDGIEVGKNETKYRKLSRILQDLTIPTLPGQHLNGMPMLFVSFNSAGCGHYDYVYIEDVQSEPEKQQRKETNEGKLPEISCSCGGSGKGKGSLSNICNNVIGSYSSRCKCLGARVACEGICACRGCSNPFGQRQVGDAEMECAPRKRRTFDIQNLIKLNSQAYLDEKGEPLREGALAKAEFFVVEVLTKLFHESREKLSIKKLGKSNEFIKKTKELHLTSQFPIDGALCSKVSRRLPPDMVLCLALNDFVIDLCLAGLTSMRKSFLAI